MSEEIKQPTSPTNEESTNGTPVNRNPLLPPLPPLPGEEDDVAPETQAAQEERVSRLAGEPAPDISPEEFARLQRTGAPINLDSRGRVVVRRREEDDPGVSLRKRRAWYG